jgi:hypothetical protein
MKKILWLLLIFTAVFMTYQGIVLKADTAEHYSLFQMEYAGAGQGKAMLQAWHAQPCGNGTLLQIAQSNTHIDFFFILVYTLLILLLSYLQMQRERGSRLNALLRLSLFLAPLIALFDIGENTLILYNIRHFNDAGLYYSPCYFSSAKWLLLAWVVIVWLASLIHTAANQQPHRPQLSAS